MGNVCSNTGDLPVRGRSPTFSQGDSPSDYALYEGDGPWFTCDPKGEMKPRFAGKGMACEEETPASTLMKMLIVAAEKKGDKPALMIERPVPEVVDVVPPALPLADWTQWTYKQYLEDVRSAAKGFVALGFQPFDSVNVWGFNAPEWLISAVAAGFAGGKVAGLYPTDTGDTAAYKVVHSGGSIVVLEDRQKLDKLVQGLEARGDARRIKAFVAFGFDPKEKEVVKVTGCGDVPLISWQALKDMGNFQTEDAEIDRRVEATQPGHCAALIYTSGTTGDPKAVMISHDNILAESCMLTGILKKSVGLCGAAAQERLVSYLPLSHVAGMMVDISMPLVSTAISDAWTTVFFARNYDLKRGSIKDRLVAAQPTIFLGVPLVWEKIADKVRAIGAQSTGLKKHIAAWAKAKGATKAQNAQLGGNGSAPTGYGLADKLVLSKAKNLLGLGCCKYGFTGAAPIRVDTLEFFGSLGIQINEVYGMSECTGACTVSTQQGHQWGSCGWELPGVEVRVFKVDDKDFNKKTECPRAPGLDTIEEEFMGEICWRGRINMMGYMANPDMGAEHVADVQKKTAEAIDKDGWLHSGDKGMLTVRGMLKITGRYKELIIGEGGENIAPVPIEDSIKKLCDGIADVMMVGDKRKYNVALVTLKAVGANGEVPGTDELDAGAKRVSPNSKTIPQAMDDQVWIDAITAAITKTNKNNKICINNSFQIQKFTILPANFSEQEQELTPTKKLKRKAVENRYAATIDKLYETQGVYIHH